MSDTLEYDLTGNFGLKKPWLDADDDIWGQHLNENFDLIDNLLVTRGFDASKYLPLTGGIITGNLTVDGQLSTGGDAFVGGTLWADDAVNVSGVLTADGVLNVNGALNAYGTLTVHDAMTVSDTLDVEGVANFDNAVNLANPPEAPGQAANKGYVDGTVSAAVGAYLPLAGGEITGNLQVDGALNVGMLAGGAGFKLDVFGSVRLSTNSVRIDNNAAAGITPASNVLLQITQADNNAGVLQVDTIQGAGQLVMRRAAGSGVARTGLLNGQIIGLLAWAGYDGAAYSGSQAYISGAADGDWSPTSHPTRLSLNLTAANSITTTEVLRVSNAGNFLLGTTVDAGFRLDVVGTARVNGLLTLLGASGLQSNGPVTVGTNTVAQTLSINGQAGANRILRFQSGGGTRWQFVVNSTAEAGANAGSNLDINNYDDTGVVLAPNPLIRITRSTGNMLINGGGVSFGPVGASTSDLSKHLNLFNGTYGINISTGRMNLVAPNLFIVNGTTDIAQFTTTGLRVIGNAGFNNTAPIAKPTLSGSCTTATAAVLKSIAAMLGSYGLATDTTTA